MAVVDVCRRGLHWGRSRTGAAHSGGMPPSEAGAVAAADSMIVFDVAVLLVEREGVEADAFVMLVMVVVVVAAEEVACLSGGPDLSCCWM